MEWGADPSQAESSWPAALQTCFRITDYSSQPFACQNFKQPAPPENKVISKIKTLSSLPS